MEVNSVLDMYEGLRFGMSNQIVAEFDEKIAAIQQFPESYQLVTRQLRRVELTIIPYQLYYSAAGDVAPILGFVPASIHPVRKHRIINHRLKEWHSEDCIRS
jgi:hypothetical protein